MSESGTSIGINTIFHNPSESLLEKVRLSVDLSLFSLKSIDLVGHVIRWYLVSIMVPVIVFHHISVHSIVHFFVSIHFGFFCQN